MRAFVIVKADPVANDTAGMLDRLKAMAMSTLLLQGSDDALHHTVLLWAVGRDEFLFQPIAAHQGGVLSTGEHQAIVRP